MFGQCSALVYVLDAQDEPYQVSESSEVDTSDKEGQQQQDDVGVFIFLPSSRGEHDHARAARGVVKIHY